MTKKVWFLTVLICLAFSMIYVYGFEEDQFTFSENIIEKSKQELSLAEINFDIEQSSYVGYSDNKLYFSVDNKLYNVDTINNEYEIIYENNEKALMYEYYITKNYILVVEFFNVDSDTYFTLSSINIMSDKKEISKFGKGVDNKWHSSTMPYIYVIEDSDAVYLNFSEEIGQSNVYKIFDDNLFLLNLNKNKSRTILRLTYGLDKDGKAYGRSIKYCGGNKNNVLFQVVEAQDGMFDHSNSSRLHRFNYNIEENYYNNAFNILNVDEIQMNELVLHLTSVKNYGIISKYNFHRPINQSGEIFKVVNGDYKLIHTIPNVKSGEDIEKSQIVGDKAYLISPRYMYFYDFENFKYYYLEDSFRNNPILTNEGLSYVELNEDYLILHQVKFKEQ